VTTSKPAAQVGPAKAAAALKAQSKTKKFPAANKRARLAAGLAADVAPDQHNQRHVHGARAPPVRLLNKHEVCGIAGVTFPTIWAWMRSGAFPRSRIVGGKSMWRSDEIDQWLNALPLRPLKGDEDEAAA
jgi:predicted DNA-binding transcriptional regulator AlpA